MNPLILNAIPMFEDNYLWTLRTPDGDGIAVDPGDASVLLQAIDAGLRLHAILITHHHHDHIGGLAQVLQHYPVPVYGPKDPRISQLSQPVSEGDRVRIDALGIVFSVLELPGHTQTHIGFYSAPWLFSGDVMFNLGCGRLFEGSPEQMLNSLDKLNSLPDSTLLCCTHEYTLSNARFAKSVEPEHPDRDAFIVEMQRLRSQNQPTVPSTIAQQRQFNPFLRTESAVLQQTLAKHLGYLPPSRVERFAAIRAWKDRF
jgi:hydroxyacylglutathione hydrolase